MKVVDAMKLLSNKNYFSSAIINQLKLVKEGQGSCVVELKVEEDHQNILGIMSGGLAATLIDVVTSVAVATLNPSLGVSVDMNITYMTAAKVGTTVLIDAKTLKLGQRMAFITCDITDKYTGKMIAQGRHTKFIG